MKKNANILKQTNTDNQKETKKVNGKQINTDHNLEES